MMQALNKEGLEKARAMIEKRFTDPSSLDSLGELTLQLEKSLALAESQLNGAVQSKLDSLKRAVDLMDESSVKLTNLSKNINKIDEKIAQTNTSISKFETLKRVHNARENLSKVIAQVESLEKVPERVAYLRSLLDDDPANLKMVFLEALKLESLRISLNKEIRVYQARRKSVVGAPPNHMLLTNPAAGGGGVSSRRMTLSGGGMKGSAGHFAKIREEVEKHLNLVPILVTEVRQRVFGNINRMWDLADSAPEDLVTSFEIIEMQHEYNQRRSAAGASEFNGLDISKEAREKVKDLLECKVEGELSLDQGEKVAPLTALCMGVNQVVTKMLIFHEDIAPCMPPHYEPMTVFVDVLECLLIPRVNNLLENTELLKVAEILDFISWVDYYKEVMENQLHFVGRASIKIFENYKADLFVEYQKRMKVQVSTWFANMKKLELEIKQNSEGTLITSNPEDMFNIIHVQLDVARDKLPVIYITQVATACLEVLEDVQQESYDYFSSQWLDLGPETMSAIINDNGRMCLKTDEFKNHFIRFVEDGDELEGLITKVEKVADEYQQLARKAVKMLAKCVLEDLNEPCFQRLFSVEWESGEALLSLATATLSDYFKDLSDWLAPSYYAALVKEVLLLVVTNYVMNIRRRFNGSNTFDSEIVAAKRVTNDSRALAAFFEGFLEPLYDGGLRCRDAPVALDGMFEEYTLQALKEALGPLFSLALLISSRQTNTVKAEVQALCALYGIDGLKASQAALLGNPSITKQERMQNIEAARHLFEEGPPPVRDQRTGAYKPAAKPYSSTAARGEYASFDSGVLLSNGPGSSGDGAGGGGGSASGAAAKALAGGAAARLGGWFRRGGGGTNDSGSGSGNAVS